MAVIGDLSRRQRLQRPQEGGYQAAVTFGVLSCLGHAGGPLLAPMLRVGTTIFPVGKVQLGNPAFDGHLVPLPGSARLCQLARLNRTLAGQLQHRRTPSVAGHAECHRSGPLAISEIVRMPTELAAI
jgi:hypothetical protein